MSPVPGDFLQSLDASVDAMFLSGIFTSIFWGIGSLQLYYYFENYSKTDELWLRAYISVVWILDTVHQAFLLHVMYMYFVKDPGMLTPPQLLVDDTIICAFIDAMVQIIFVVRAWHLSNKNRLLTTGLVVVVIIQFTAVTVYFARARRLSNFFGFSGLIDFERAMNITIAVTDIFITTTIIVLLRKLSSEFRRTNSMVDKLVAYTMSTGLITAICAVGGLISGEVSRGSLVYVFFDNLFPKLYLNCLLASMNARSKIRNLPGAKGEYTNIYLDNLPTRAIERTVEPTNTSNKVSRLVAAEHRISLEIEFASIGLDVRVGNPSVAGSSTPSVVQ